MDIDTELALLKKRVFALENSLYNLIYATSNTLRSHTHNGYCCKSTIKACEEAEQLLEKKGTKYYGEMIDNDEGF